MRYNSLVYKICKIITLARKPLNINEILTELENNGNDTSNRNSLGVTLSSSILFKKSHQDCSCCGREMTIYSLTDKAKMSMAEVDSCMAPLSKEEYESFGIMVSEDG